jgi:hypothetical protein
MLFHINYDGLILRCLKHNDAERVLRELQDGPIGGHFVGETMAHKILRFGYYWPTIFRDAHAYAMKCKSCQLSVGRENRGVISL